MTPFSYHRAGDAGEALRLVGGADTHFLGGGTNLVDLMKLGVETPDLLVDVDALDLGGIDDLPGGGLRIGAGVRGADLAADPRVRSRYPVLARALEHRRRAGEEDGGRTASLSLSAEEEIQLTEFHSVLNSACQLFDELLWGVNHLG